MNKNLPLCVLLALAGCAGRHAAPPRPLDARLLPSSIPADRPAMEELTAGLRGRIQTLGLNGPKISRALVLLPRDRVQAGVINFEIESGPEAGLYQCEILGRGETSVEPKPGWSSGLINGVTIYYAPQDVTDGATIPGVYDARNISPDKYEIAALGKPEDLAGEEEFLAAIKDPDGQPKPYFSAVYKHWYNKSSAAVPVDLIWNPTYNQAGPRYFERRPSPSSPEAQARLQKQLSHNPRYYYGPYGRTGFAVHTDRWDSPERRSDPRYSNRRELADFRYRDTSGCLKLRPPCLQKLNHYITDQEQLGRQVQIEVIETPMLDR